jgi:signal peptidase I
MDISETAVPQDRDGGSAPDEGAEPPRSGAVRRLLRPGLPRDLALLVLICAVVLLLVGTFVAEPMGVPSGSMEQGLRPGDRILVDKLAYDLGPVRRGDVVVFDGQDSFSTGSETFVKRVVGVGGDTVVCCDRRGRITVDGVPLDESGYLFPGDAPSAFPFSIRVPAGRLFVLGDHRSESADSRAHLGDPGGGFVPVSRVIGRVDWIILPLSHWRHLTRPAAYAALESGLRKGVAGGHQG